MEHHIYEIQLNTENDRSVLLTLKDKNIKTI